MRRDGIKGHGSDDTTTRQLISEARAARSWGNWIGRMRLLIT